MTGTQLMRSQDDRVIAGVAGGIAAHYGLDPTLVRVIWALSLFFGGLGAIAYLVLYLVLPVGTPTVPAVRIAEERFARGEIDSDELERIRSDLGAAT
jgi:phage shock protein PspC (stress-responsive transcriptional regulator)